MSETAEKRFRTSGDLTSDLVRKTYIAFSGKYRQSKTHKVLVVVIGIEVLLLAALSVFRGEGFQSLLPLVIFAGVYVLLDLVMNWFVRYGAEMTVKRFEEESHTGVRGNTSSFTDTQVYLENHGSGGACYISLADMKRLMQVEDVWMLVTKTAAFVPIFVNQLSETDRESVLRLLKTNNPRIKIQLPKKK